MAVLTTVESASAIGTRTVTVRVADSSTARSPMAHVTVPAVSVQPGSAETNVVPAGSGSLIVTPVAGSGPLLITASVQVSWPPAATVAGPVFVSFKSATGPTVTSASPLSVSPPPGGCGVVVLTVAVFVQMPFVVPLATTVIVWSAATPTPRSPIAHVTVSAAVVHPGPVAEISVRPAGIVSVSATLRATTGRRCGR